MFEDDVDHAGVVGGEGGVFTLVEQQAGETRVTGVHVALVWPGDGGRFVVSAFAEADGDAEGVETAKVVSSPVEVGLEDGAEAIAAGVQVLDDLQGAVDIFAGLHVDFDTRADRAGFIEDGCDISAAEGVRDVESELGELDGDGGRERGGGDRVESQLDAGAGGGGFFRGSDVFAEVIEGRENALLLEAAGDGDDVFEALSGDEAAREAGCHRRGFHPATELAAAGEEEESGSQHTGLILLYGIRSGRAKEGAGVTGGERKISVLFLQGWRGRPERSLAGRGFLETAGGRTGMATRQAKKKATRKTAQPRRAPRKATKKATGLPGKSGAAELGAAARGPEAEREEEKPNEKATPRKRTSKLDKKKLGEMVDKMLLQLAEQVEGGECKITTSEGVRLIQLREALGLDRPSAVKVEWVEPKGE